MEIIRTQYLEKLRLVRDKKLIKVITGIRRVGKSTLLKQFRDELLAEGIDASRVQFLNFEEERNTANGGSWREIHRKIEEKLVRDGMNYVFLDEIQNVLEWEKLVDSLYVKENVDLYLTGSNAYFLSSEFSTLLSGRQFEIRVLPFSYLEYGKMSSGNMMGFLRYGGMPQAVEFLPDENLVVEYLEGVYNTVVMKDVVSRGGIRDVEVLDRIMRYAFDNIGNGFSAKKVADYLSSNYRKVSPETVERCLRMMEEAFVLFSAQRYNVRGRELLKTQKKYYLVDMGLRNVLIARGETFDVGRALENTVYLELLRRGYRVFVGQTGSGKEVDFVARRRDGVIEYYQVCETMRGEMTRERELVPFKEIQDNYAKIVISMDVEENDFEGIKQVNVEKWLRGSSK